MRPLGEKASGASDTTPAAFENVSPPLVAPRPTRDEEKRELLLLVLCALFVGFFVTAEILGSKLWSFSLFGITPKSLGISNDENFVATAGIFAFPLTFILTDIINEYFGRRIVKVFTWLAIGVNLILQPVILGAAWAPTVSFTPGLSAEVAHAAYKTAFGQTWAIVAASLVAFAIGQYVDVWVFTWLRRKTGGKMLWLRSQGSTVVSQVVDTGVVIFVAFLVIPMLLGNPHMTAGQAATISITNYVYKFVVAVLITPILYLVHGAVEKWLGHTAAERLAHAAHPADPD
jgi:uncharacterized integral membrane protein (TIGR00697 family)